MRLAVISDIHGNLHALESVWADLQTLSPDAVVCPGDLVGYSSSGTPTYPIKNRLGAHCS
jgi:predicted phosphodiesterase